MTENAPPPPRRLRPRRVLLIGLLSAAVALVLTLVIGNFLPAGASQCAPQVVKAQKVDAVATGPLAALSGTGNGRGYADMAFKDEAGKAMKVSDFAGKALLVNFWASWCVPCRAEMPALDALAAKYNSDKFMVLPINLDIGEGGEEKAKKFIADEQLKNLPLFADNTFSAFERLKTSAVSIGLPTTLLLDDKGCELAVLQGPAEWDTPQGHQVIDALVGA